MNEPLQRRGVTGTFGESIGWLRRNPVLIVVFLAYTFLELLGELSALLGLLAFLAFLYVGGLAHMIGRDEAAGDPVSLGRNVTVVLERLPWLIGVAILYVLVVGIGLVLLVLPGIYIAVRLSLALPACVIDERCVIDSLRASWSAAEGNLAKLFGITLTLFLVLGGAGLASLLVTGSDEGFYALFLLVTIVLTPIVMPVVEFAYARVYLENRSRSDTGWAGDAIENRPGAGPDGSEW